MAADRIRDATLTLAAAAAAPFAGGLLTLLTKPFGGVVGVPAQVVGYLTLTAFAAGILGAVVTMRYPLSPGLAAILAIPAGAGLAIAGATSAVWVFSVGVIVAGALAGPVLVCSRSLTWASASSTWWQTAMIAGFAGAAAVAAFTQLAPGAGLVAAGILTAVSGAVSYVISSTPQDSPVSQEETGARREPVGIPWRTSVFYGLTGLVVGGTVLPALHLLLFRWSELGREQAMLLLPAGVLALLVMALPAPSAGNIAPLIILAAGGPLLVATAPGSVTVAIGVCVTVVAATCAARGLDRVATGSAGPTAILTALGVAAGFGAVSVAGEFLGNGTALTVLTLTVLGGVSLGTRTTPAPERGIA